MPPSTKEELPEQYVLPIVETPMIEHISRMRCGAYTSEWVSTALGIKGLSTNETFKESLLADLLRPMLPRMVLDLLEERGIDAYSDSLGAYVDSYKLFWLKRELVTKEKPVLVLVRTTTLHWIVVAGYDDLRQLFFVYDPNFGHTSVNKDVPVGNREVAYNLLLAEWSGSLMFQYNVVILRGLLSQEDQKEDSKEEEK